MVVGSLFLTVRSTIFVSSVMSFRIVAIACSDSDTEVLLAFRQHHGSTCLPLLNGMFTAIWDSHTLELTIARDASGIKPLFGLDLAAVVF